MKANGEAMTDAGSANPFKSSVGMKSSSTAAANTGGLAGLQNEISLLVKQNSNSDQGIHIRDICAYLKNVPQQKIREALDFLSNEGHVYTTVDDDHFRSTDSQMGDDGY